MTPDEIVTEIFKIQQLRNPDSDPGDLTIAVQDDMPLVVVGQPRASREDESFATSIILGQGTAGHNIQNALESFLEEVQDGVR